MRRPPTYRPRVREIRELLGIEQAALAQAAGVSVDALYRMECNKVTPAASLVRKIADALGVETYQLFEIDGDGGVLPVVKAIRAAGGPNFATVTRRDRRAPTIAALPAPERELLDGLAGLGSNLTDAAIDTGLRVIAEHLQANEGKATIGRLRHLATVWISATAANVPDALARLDVALHRLTNRGAA